MRIFECTDNFRVDERSLDFFKSEKQNSLYTRNIIWNNCFCIDGKASCVVIKTGNNKCIEYKTNKQNIDSYTKIINKRTTLLSFSIAFVDIIFFVINV